MYGAVQDGLDGALGEGWLAPSGTARGPARVRRPARRPGLVIHYDAEAGDAAAEVPLS